MRARPHAAGTAVWVAGILSCCIAFADTPSRRAPEPVAAPAAPVMPPPEVRLNAATPMVRELLTVHEQQQRRLALVRAALVGTRDRVKSAELQQQIESIKRETDLQMLTIQAVYARREGRIAMAEHFEAEVTRMATFARPNRTATPATAKPARSVMKVKNPDAGASR